MRLLGGKEAGAVVACKEEVHVGEGDALCAELSELALDYRLADVVIRIIRVFLRVVN